MKKLFLIIFGIWFSISIAYSSEPNKGYKGFVGLSLGDAYNFNTAQLISVNNMQLYGMLSTTHGYQWKNWFFGGGIGYYHSFRDKENMYPLFVAGRYTFSSIKINPFCETRAGMIYDPRWVEPLQVLGSLCTGVYINNDLQVGLRLSVFSRPSRYFTANAAVAFSYSFGQ